VKNYKKPKFILKDTKNNKLAEAKVKQNPAARLHQLLELIEVGYINVEQAETILRNGDN